MEGKGFISKLIYNPPRLNKNLSTADVAVFAKHIYNPPRLNKNLKD